MINNIESYNKAQLIELVEIQMEEYQEASKRIAELEKERDELNEKFEEYFDAFMNCKCIPRNMEAHNLEQQIAGMQRVLDCRELDLTQGEISTIKLMQEQLAKEQGQ